MSGFGEREEQEKQLLRNALTLAENASRAKSDFLSRMSREIVVPVESIMTMARTIRDNEGDLDILGNCVERIENSGRYLLNMFENLIEMSKIENGGVVLESNEMILDDLLEEIVSEVSEPVKEKMLSFKVKNLAEKELLEHYFIADHKQISQILLRLLTNSFRFTPSGGHVELEIASEKNPLTDLYTLNLVVRDNGIGIKKEDMSIIFSPFEQGKTVEDTCGVGLGLAICKSLVELMGGTIRVESEEGQGTSIFLAIPVKLGDKLLTEQEQECVLSSPEAPRILLADDNLFNAEMTSTILRLNGYVVESAVHGIDAVNKFKEKNPGYYQAILMDVMMPIRNGIMASVDIRNLDREDAKSIPIIAMSRKRPPEEDRMMGKIITDYIPKPVESVRLLEMLKMYLKK